MVSYTVAEQNWINSVNASTIIESKLKFNIASGFINQGSVQRNLQEQNKLVHQM